MNTVENSGKSSLIPFVLAVLVTAILVAVIVYAKTCPCDRTPGLWLSGEASSKPVKNWSFANNAGLCQLQVYGVLPHSINLNCMSAEQRLFLSCSDCSGKAWSRYALADPEGWIKIFGVLYPVSMSRITDEDQLDKAWAARLRKVSRNSKQPRPDHWWSFELTSRIP